MTLPDETERAAGRAPAPLLIFLALMTSVVALTIDAILPAVDAIGAELDFADPTDGHLLILAVFAGIGIGQPFFGPLSDSIGRKRTAMIGWVVYAIGGLVAVTAPGLTGIVAGRLLQGIGAAGPRVVATAIVRDLYDGRPMARIISLVMTVFMLVPIFAPLVGQILEAAAGWRAIFGLYLALAVVSAGWYLAWVPETLAPEDRRPLRLGPLAAAFGEVLRTPTSMLYTLASTAIFAAFAALLSSAQEVFENLLGLGEAFPIAFASLAICFAAAQFANSRLVIRVGMRPLSRGAAVLVMAASGVATAVALSPVGPVPPFWVFLVVMAPVFLGTALMFSNLTALALEPLGHVAGTASAVVMSVSTLGAVPAGWLISERIDGTLVPLFAGFFGAAVVALGAMTLAERWRTE